MMPTSLNGARSALRKRQGAVARCTSILACALVVGCHNYPCPAVGFAEGEQFRITVLARHSDAGLCPVMDVPSLQPGDTFTLVGGKYVDMESTGCTRLGRPGPAPFSTDVLVSCTEGRSQLGLQCMGETAAGCALTADVYVSPRIAPGVSTIEQGTLTVGWLMAASCNTGSCVDTYDVRIERLAP